MTLYDTRGRRQLAALAPNASPRERHLHWCKERALGELHGSGGRTAAIASMTSDLGKFEEPMYDASALGMLTMDAMMFCHDVDDMQDWILGFN